MVKKKLSRNETDKGFSLLELMIVIAIIGIMATQGYTIMNSSGAKVKGQIARLRADVNLARVEAVNRNQAVLVDFFLAGETDADGVTWPVDGYRICVDSGGANLNTCDLTDILIGEVRFNASVAYYDLAVPAPDGPDVNATAAAGAWVAGDGITLGGNRMSMLPNGTVNQAGTIYLYGPDGNGGIAGAPMAMVVLNTGRFTMRRWRLGEWLSR